MKSRLNRRGLFTLLARPFQQRNVGFKPAVSSHGIGAERQENGATPNQTVAIIQGRHCLALTSFCSVCLERCPVPGALRLVNGMPMVVPDACTGCAVCRQVCPAPTNAVLLLPRQPCTRTVSNPSWPPSSSSAPKPGLCETAFATGFPDEHDT